MQTNTFDLGYKLNTPTTQNIFDKSYSYDLNANVESISATSLTLESFNCDTLDRLISANGDYGDISYGYDANHNRLTKSILTDNSKEQTLNYQSTNNHIDTVSITNSTAPTLSTYQYDALGNVINNKRV
ncbi:hypothetical protein [Abyssogena phaseoliformis symbiont]|uniref:hypothetical protein n=1 Tax=Abyssogena phaseoliformis symbiont TaxID=596095 RepID=UPI0019153136|nr:hypothetical protein [Abyssogena phaseoliformis symbiont]